MGSKWLAETQVLGPSSTAFLKHISRELDQKCGVAGTRMRCGCSGFNLLHHDTLPITCSSFIMLRKGIFSFRLSLFCLMFNRWDVDGSSSRLPMSFELEVEL